MATRIYPSARDRILDAAERLVVSRGVNSLTIEAVITEAQISKGGFFHHFATKDALLTAIIDRLSKRMADDAAERAAQDPEPRGARLRAQIALAFDAERRDTAAPRALLLALIEAAGGQPEIARHISALNAEAFAHDVAEDVPEGRAIAIQLALDGFWLSQALGTAALTERQLQALRDALLALAQPEAEAGRGPARPRALRKGGRT
ncbi:TetR/AcrR family transcriptional regulator [Sorangium cellulosum]|uniref:TetR family transcriptional regulator n=1 Tax=Sorangium cellulosum TaxID=56 RepID=A0A150QHJ4_SORCE|nr:TetR/AcrR family transcriptional regulator [Sorangium cellulosum]KYF67431.1 TetR family transcriptional regulator [Sorangium cellulosum]